MCEYYVKADPIQYEQRSRTLRIHGILTTIRLENSFWDILAEMAESEDATTNALITQFHDEILAHKGEIPNFASFLRVTCVRYLRKNMIHLEKELEKSSGVHSIISEGDNVHTLPTTSNPSSDFEEEIETNVVKVLKR
ncbi:ribbon-helix-helix domain-containing protein [Ferrovum sp. PN-J185]|uniref:ribbon-helix-helix domain-containing protein n=1 Tax=Ferrovum sp. PN-J185 TaxID=1356306 RepID=UPI0007953B61|nr:ribbon-helix-helix domain-containing protein [Ferrovum sp. PN-J185]KXW56744.1 hypothetical protein FV185_07030 [Ferrovum sp. PN-J185]MCC6067571.1 ribbon-helix-helix domain-containing protein [Ferrovum sp. PN-J185]MDE1892069.1 ribbon-helix-helix domain-containing protein [Betaproteobacteria bacterium]MDE2056482.1 ribbon-helix-helix domain-containing protein [Betaproteobacteria bacterium]